MAWMDSNFCGKLLENGHRKISGGE